MPKRRKKSAQPRQRRRRPPVKTQLLHLHNDILLKIFKYLGLNDTLSPYTLRKTATAFPLACSCSKLYGIFRDHITELNACLTPWKAPPLYHPTTSSAHLSWCIRNLPRLRKICLPRERSELVTNFPKSLNIADLEVCGDVTFRLPKSLEKFSLDFPGERAMKYLAGLHERPSCRLSRLSLSAMPVSLIDDFIQYFDHSAQFLRQLYISFLLDRDPDQRVEENEHATSLISHVASTYETNAPTLFNLSFALPDEARNDSDWDDRELEYFERVLPAMRNANLRMTSLHTILVFTDTSLLDSWFVAIRPAITTFNTIFIEAGFSFNSFFSPIYGDRGPVAGRRITTNLTAANIEQIRGRRMDEQLHALYITERAVVDKFIHGHPSYRELVKQCFSVTGGIYHVRALFAFGLRATKMGVWNDHDASDMNAVLVQPHAENPEEAAYMFLIAIAEGTKWLGGLDVSFELIQFAVDNEGYLWQLMDKLEGLTELKLSVPLKERSDEPAVEMMEKFLIGLPLFFGILEESCEMLQKVEVIMHDKIVLQEPVDLASILRKALDAIDTFNERRPEVEVESFRALVAHWGMQFEIEHNFAGL